MDPVAPECFFVPGAIGICVCGVGISCSGTVGICVCGIVVSCSVACCGCLCQAMPYGVCWWSWLRALASTTVAVNPPTTHISPGFAHIGNSNWLCTLRMSRIRNLLSICEKQISVVFISPPRRNLPSPILVSALAMELLCSRFCISWYRCESVSFFLPDGAWTLTTSMHSSSLSPGMMHRNACALRRCPGTS